MEASATDRVDFSISAETEFACKAAVVEHVDTALWVSCPACLTRLRLILTLATSVSLDQHGGSLSTFYRLIEAYSKKHPHAGNLLIIKDENDRRFGVYMNEWIKRVEGTYTGSGES